ncbi:MAG TPA: hypothetical protein VN782_05865 [Usitatibacter sp.]|nr:hypothetical protein [Usitatibacter sp.]
MTLERERLAGVAFVLRAPVQPAIPRPPLICFLHGYDEGAPLPVAEGAIRHGPLREGSSQRAEGFVVVAPQLPVRGDFWHRYANEVHAIVTLARERFDADAGRLYLTGFSFGGNGVFDLALEQGAFWAALWAVDPTRPPRRALRQPVWLSFGAVARRARGLFVRSLRLAPFEGELDRPRVWLDEGADHVESARLAYRDDRIYDWLLEWRAADRGIAGGRGS